MATMGEKKRLIKKMEIIWKKNKENGEKKDETKRVMIIIMKWRTREKV